MVRALKDDLRSWLTPFSHPNYSSGSRDVLTIFAYTSFSTYTMAVDIRVSSALPEHTT